MSTSIASLFKHGADLMDLADSFALLFDQLDDPEEAPTALDVSRSLTTDTPDVLAAAVHCRALGFVPRNVMRTVISKGDARERLALLRALDFALGHVNEFTGVPGATALARYRARLEQTQKLNDTAPGLVLPKRTGPGRPRSSKFQDWRDCLQSLIRIRSVAPGLQYFRVDPEWDFPVEVREVGATPIAAVAFIDRLDDLDVSRRDDPEGQSWYSIHPKPIDEWDARYRIEQTLDALDRSGAYMGVLPELVLTDEVLELWREVMRARPRPGGSNLHWLMVGTGPVTNAGPNDDRDEQPPNRAVVMDRTHGTPVQLPSGDLYVQDKRRGFTLSPGHVSKWGLKTLEGDPAKKPIDLGEWMKEGRTRLLVDSRLGRVAIMICEDHGRLLAESSELAVYGPSHVIVPIFSEPIRRHYWEEKGAQQLATEIGSSTLVVNSSAITVEGELDSCCGALLVYVDPDADEEGWPTVTKTSEPLAAATKPQLFEVPRA